MARPRPAPSVAARLDALYAEVPAIECQGLCWDSCGRLDMSSAERRRIKTEGGVEIPDGTKAAGPSLCVALTMFRRCGVYAIRPLVCRLWGVIESLPCTFGCRPERMLSDEEAYELIAQALDISGQHEQAAEVREPWSTPERAAATAAALREQRRQRDLDYDIREALAKRNGSVIYAAGRGRLAKTSPHRGDR